jgi:hypothetical protein
VGYIGMVEGLQQGVAVVPGLFGVRVAPGLVLGQPEVLDASGVAVEPDDRDPCGQPCGSIVVAALRAARRYSATFTSRLSRRIVASTWAELVRCQPGRFSRPASRIRPRIRSSRCFGVVSASWRSRNSLSTE